MLVASLIPGALGGVEPAFVELGCMACNYDAAARSCRLGYHLCNLRELYSGGYAAARQMGWATSNSHTWSREEADAGGAQSSSWSGEAPGTSQLGLGICCADSE